jgi:hypothetical protein
MKPRIYIETTVISYLTAKPARDILSLARQEMTRQFWEWAPSNYELCYSALTRVEVSRGDPGAAERRVAILQDCTLLSNIAETESLAERLMGLNAVPSTEPEDAAHIAIATLSQMKYIASWNFSHMVGPQSKRLLDRALLSLGYTAPLLATPEEIFEEESK